MVLGFVHSLFVFYFFLDTRVIKGDRQECLVPRWELGSQSPYEGISRTLKLMSCIYMSLSQVQNVHRWSEHLVTVSRPQCIWKHIQRHQTVTKNLVHVRTASHRRLDIYMFETIQSPANGPKPIFLGILYYLKGSLLSSASTALGGDYQNTAKYCDCGLMLILQTHCLIKSDLIGIQE